MTTEIDIIHDKNPSVHYRIYSGFINLGESRLPKRKLGNLLFIIQSELNKRLLKS